MYITLTLRSLRRHLQWVQQEYSYTELVDLQWMRHALLLFVFVYTCNIILNVVSELVIPVPGCLTLNLVLLLSLAIFWLGYRMLSLPDTQVPKQPADARYQRSSLTVTDAQAHLRKLEDAMKTEKLFPKVRSEYAGANHAHGRPEPSYFPGHQSAAGQKLPRLRQWLPG